MKCKYILLSPLQYLYKWFLLLPLILWTSVDGTHFYETKCWEIKQPKHDLLIVLIVLNMDRTRLSYFNVKANCFMLKNLISLVRLKLISS